MNTNSIAVGMNVYLDKPLQLVTLTQQYELQLQYLDMFALQSKADC